MKVNVTGEMLSQEEIQQYINRANEKFSNKKINGLDLHVDGEYVEIRYHIEPEKFHRIRRITGYLVGTLDRFNNAKRAEESERVKHNPE